MMSNSNVEAEKKTSPSCPFSSLPYDLALSCLARVSRSDHAALSPVSKRYHSLVVSPDFYKTRSILGCKEECLYVCVRNIDDSAPFWFILSRGKPVNRFISRFPSQPPRGSSVVALDWGIYVIGGLIKGNRTSDVSLFDCRTHTWRHVPSMGVARVWAAAGVVDGKIYVFGGCDNIDDSSSWGEVFDPKTQTWDTLVPSSGCICLEYVHASLVIEEKVYAVENKWTTACSQSLYYSPSEGKWETVRL